MQSEAIIRGPQMRRREHLHATREAISMQSEAIVKGPQVWGSVPSTSTGGTDQGTIRPAGPSTRGAGTQRDDERAAARPSLAKSSAAMRAS